MYVYIYTRPNTFCDLGVCQMLPTSSLFAKDTTATATVQLGRIMERRGATRGATRGLPIGGISGTCQDSLSFELFIVFVTIITISLESLEQNQNNLDKYDEFRKSRTIHHRSYLILVRTTPMILLAAPRPRSTRHVPTQISPIFRAI